MKLLSRRWMLAILCITGGLAVTQIFFHGHLRVGTHPRLARLVNNTLHLRFGHNFKVNSALHVAAEKFAEIARHETNGRVEVTIYPEQQIGTDDQMIEMARNGTLDILLVPTANLSAAMPAMQYSDIPFFFRNREEAYQMLDGEPGKLILEKLNAIDLIGVTFWENGFKQLTANRPIHEPEDLKGLKMRVMKSRIIMDQFNAFGAQPIPLEFHATYNALKDGIVDGQENPLAVIVMMDFYKVQSHLTLSNHGYLAYAFVISQKVFQSLPNEIGLRLIDIARRLTSFEREETRRREAELLETIRRAGVTVQELTEEKREEFSAITAHIPHQFEGVIGLDIMAKTEELMRESRLGDAVNSDILIALDTDLSINAASAGLAIKRGAMIAINEINERGGVLGRKLALIARDNRGLPERGARNILDLASRPNLVAILGGSSSNVVLGEIDTIHQVKIPLLIPRAAAVSVVDNGYSPNFVFRLSVSDRDSDVFLINYALTKAKRPALLLINSALGRENHLSLTNTLRQHNITPTIVEWFNSGERDFAAHLSHIETSKADIVIVVATAAESVHIVNSMAKQSHSLPMVSNWGVSNSNMRDEARSALENIDLTFIQSFSFLTSRTPKTPEILQRYMTTFDVSSARDIFVPDGTAHAYDLVHLLALAITQAGSINREAVRDALEHIDTYAGLIKIYHQPFTSIRHEALSVSDYHLSRYDSAGVIVPVQSGNNASR
ncbi:TRAP-type transport system periplasmic protein [Gammaproteobacteria bacterium]